jgi:hypothetical protein
MTEGRLEAHLRPLERLVGRTFRGTLSEPGAQKAMVDVSRWERALNGMAVRNLHSVNDGEYGGDTVLCWNRELQTLDFFYFTTAGFLTRGTMTAEPGIASTREQVTAQSELLADGRLRTSSQYLRNGQWVEGPSGTCVPDDSAVVRFR